MPPQELPPVAFRVQEKMPFYLAKLSTLSGLGLFSSAELIIFDKK